VTISKSKSRYQTNLRNLQCPPEVPNYGIKEPNFEKLVNQRLVTMKVLSAFLSKTNFESKLNLRAELL